MRGMGRHVDLIEALFPWSRHLPADQRRQFGEELQELIARWYATAQEYGTEFEQPGEPEE